MVSALAGDDLALSSGSRRSWRRRGDVHVGSRALPTLLNATLNAFKSVLGMFCLAPSKKREIQILKDVCGIVKLSRMTLLLGPPSSGKTTLLLALAGKLDRDLRVSGRINYCGHELNELVPQKTCAYISQHDIHYGEMTVRETLDFSGRCLGVGTRYEPLVELSRRDREAGIKPDPEIDAFMKAIALSGRKTNLVTYYVLKFYPAWAFGLPIWLLRIPLSIMESGIWIVLTYYTIGFAPSASRFFRQFLALFGIHQMALSLFRFLAAAGRTLVVANTLGTFSLQLVFVLGGFVIAKDPRINAPTVGEVLLKSRGFYTEEYWFWICIGALLGFSLLFNLLFIFWAIQKQSLWMKVTKRIRSYLVDNISSKEMRSRGIIKDRLQLLQDVSGAFRPGILTALVGVSGAGKTTLMDVLAGRKTGGYTEGSVSISGYPKNQATFARISGYCEQNDIHSPHVTVYESLLFSAWLRLPSDVNAQTPRVAMRTTSSSKDILIQEDNEQDLKWDKIQRFPMFDRLRKGMLRLVLDRGNVVPYQVVDVTNQGLQDKKLLLESVLKDDNEKFLRKFRERVDRVGIEIPKIEVRFENLSVEGDVHVGRRALPTLHNVTLNAFERILGMFQFASFRKRKNHILKDVSGIVKPSRMTLLLGPPGAGKTTLLLALAEKLDRDLRAFGRVTYCGHDLNEFVAKKTCAYISQHDLHHGEMTVRETLDFSAHCLGVGTRYEMLKEISRREREAGIKPDPEIVAFMKGIAISGQKNNLITDYIIKILGLDICADIKVGDNMRRGISGGQKKRVTTGEMLVGPAKVFFMDEISTGLDSSTTFQICKFLRQMIHTMEVTMLVSLLQPAPETYELFDDIILLSEGQIVYQGPREHVLEFFENMGFKCPERKGVADFLQEVTSKKDQQQYWSRRNEPYRYVSVPEFAGKKLASEIKVPYDKSQTNEAALVKKKYGISNWELLKACFSREWLFMKRDIFVYIYRIVHLTVLSILGFTVFFRTEMPVGTVENGQKFYGALFFTLFNMMFNGSSEQAMIVSRLPVFYKQRDFMFYPAWAFALPVWILRIPISFLESGIWIALTYYTTGFAPSSSRFFRHFLALFGIHQMSLSLYRLIGATGRTHVVANILCGLICQVIFVLGGSIVAKNNIKPWMIWGYYISPMMYGQNAIVINEFLDERWSQPNTDPRIGATTVGKVLLKSKAFSDSSKAFIMDDDDKKNKKSTNKHRIIEDIAVKKSSELVGCPDQERRTRMILPFQPLSLSFSHEMKNQGINEDRLQLLRDVSGAFRPGILTALMGVSGAGKTTLLDVLVGRKTGGYIEGSISISGHLKNQATYARVSGYCEQNDIHSPYVTVYESLLFSAWLRLPSHVNTQTRKMFVEEVMEWVELKPIKDALVGLPGIDGLSTEQRKRLTIAVELVANPSIILMDEPTSGLDARAAAIVMRTVRKTVDTGRTVVCTIHQPSIDIFEAFDELLLMKRGGQVIYAGPLGHHSQKLIEYFEAIAGIQKIKDGYNPATWMLDISTPSMEAQLDIDFAKIYVNSTLYQMNQELIKELSTPTPGSKDLFFPTKYSQSFFVQWKACLWKQYWSYWRNPPYNGIRFFFTLAYGVMFGLIFWKRAENIQKQQDLFDLLGAMFSTVMFLGTMNAVGVQPVVDIERTVLYRERAAGMYSALPYALGQVVIEIMYSSIQTVMYTIIIHSMMGFKWNVGKFLSFYYYMLMCFIYFTLYGMMTIALTPSYQIASICISFFLCIWNLFSGFFIPRVEIPVWWRWFYWATPNAWTIYGLVTSQLGDEIAQIDVPGAKSMGLKELLKENMGFDYDFLPVVAIVHTHT
ncbi:ABC transporter G family member 39 [Glycine max]|nr:ABC transporter G family member 39 [Glycine max]